MTHLALALLVSAGACVNPIVCRVEQRTLAQLEMIQAVLKLFVADTGEYPPNLDALFKDRTGVAGWDGPYLKKPLPTDGWGQPFLYRQPAQHGARPFDLYSKGANGTDDHGHQDDITRDTGIPCRFYECPAVWPSIIVLFGLGLGFLLLGVTMARWAKRRRAA